VSADIFGKLAALGHGLIKRRADQKQSTLTSCQKHENLILPFPCQEKWKGF